MLKTPPKRRKQISMWQRFRRDMRMRLVSGLLVIVPLGVTAFALGFLYDLTAGRLAPHIEQWCGPMPEYVVMGISVLAFLGGVYLVGLIATFLLGRQLIAFAETFIQRIPVVKTVYTASKQVVEGFSPQTGDAASREAILIDFPAPGMRAVGFLTGRVRLPDGREYVKVFVPTTPNVTVGLFQIVALHEAYHCNLTAEEAIKMILSAGIVAPSRLTLTPMSESTERKRRGRARPE